MPNVMSELVNAKTRNALRRNLQRLQEDPKVRAM